MKKRRLGEGGCKHDSRMMGFQQSMHMRTAEKKGWGPVCKHNVRMMGFKFRVSGFGLRAQGDS